MKCQSQTIISKVVTVTLDEEEAKLLYNYLGELCFSHYLSIGFSKELSEKLSNLTSDLYDHLGGVILGGM